MILHIVNKASALDDCLRLAPAGGTLLLIEDGVLAALAGPANGKRLEMAAGLHKLYVLAPDLAARGIAAKVPAFVERVDYAGFVELCTRHEKAQSWF